MVENSPFGIIEEGAEVDPLHYRLTGAAGFILMDPTVHRIHGNASRQYQALADPGSSLEENQADNLAPRQPIDRNGAVV